MEYYNSLEMLEQLLREIYGVEGFFRGGFKTEQEIAGY